MPKGQGTPLGAQGSVGRCLIRRPGKTLSTGVATACVLEERVGGSGMKGASTWVGDGVGSRAPLVLALATARWERWETGRADWRRAQQLQLRRERDAYRILRAQVLRVRDLKSFLRVQPPRRKRSHNSMTAPRDTDSTTLEPFHSIIIRVLRR